MAQKTGQYTSELRKQGKLEGIVRDNDTEKLGTRDDRKKKFQERRKIKRRGPSLIEKTKKSNNTQFE